jgi:UDP-glucose 4-epimerase
VLPPGGRGRRAAHRRQAAGEPGDQHPGQRDRLREGAQVRHPSAGHQHQRDLRQEHQRPLGEEDDRILGSPLKSRWSYSEAKAIEEILAYTYWRQKGLQTYIVRLFNTVGPRQTGHYGMVIPRFVSQAIKGEPLTVYGDGKQTRCFCYVGDAVSGMVAISEHPESSGRAYNLGGTEEVSMEELARRVIHVAGSDSKIRYVPYDEAYEEGFEDMQRRVPDTTRARELVGFAPTVDLDGIIRSVVDDQRR